MSSALDEPADAAELHVGGRIAPLPPGLHALVVGAIRHSESMEPPITRVELRSKFEQAEAATKLLCEILDDDTYLAWFEVSGDVPIKNSRATLDDLFRRAHKVLTSLRRGAGGDKAYPGSAFSSRGLCWAFVDRWFVLSELKRPAQRDRGAIKLADELWMTATGKASLLDEANEAWRHAFGEVKSASVASLNHIEQFMIKWART